ncbi:MAG: hypothetical protein AMXMBFR34_26600 [Myxococcaceae bacterium]
MRIPRGVWGIVKETARHLLRRPVVGLVALARVPDRRLVLVRRGDTGGWGLPGGTLEWGETLRQSLERELREEAGVELLEAGELLGVYSAPWRDLRFHAVTVVVGARVSMPAQAPLNPLEILEVKLFAEAELPAELSHGMTEVLERARKSERHWE